MAARDRGFRGLFDPELVPLHPGAAGRLVGEVRHACPECPLGVPRPLCDVCNGVGSITADRLAMYAYVQNLKARGAGTAGGLILP
jgi:hypothetical protein